MPLTTDFNTSPFFDDFDPSKEYYRILFRPATAIQGRELNSMQSQIQNQIEIFGNHMFESGAVIHGCSFSDIPQLPFVYINDTSANGNLVDISTLLGTTVVSNTSNLTARVIATLPGSVGTYPNTGAAYLKYLNTGNTGATIFANNETITFYNSPRTGNDAIDVVCVTNTYLSNSTTITTGTGHGISVTDGFIYEKGYFIKVDSQVGIINAYSTYAGNSLVGFTTLETIITPDQDPSLNDNALGYSNESAPGAYRLKLTPVITTVANTEQANVDNFAVLGMYNFGSLIIKSDTEYNELGDSLARISKETNGNFVIKPFNIDTVPNPSGNSQLLDVRINPGLGYADGFRIELLRTAYVDVRRGVDTSVSLEQQITTSYDEYIVCDNVVGSFDCNTHPVVTFYDLEQDAIERHTYSDGSTIGTAIGAAQLRMVDFVSGVPGSQEAIYRFWIYNINMFSGKSFWQARSIVYAPGGSPKGSASLDIQTIYGSGSGLCKTVYPTGKAAVLRLTNGANNINTSYVARKKSTGTIQSDGTITLNITSSGPGGTDIFPYGVGVYTNDEIVNDFMVVASATGSTANLSGTVAANLNNRTITGTSTTFRSDFGVGEIIKIGSQMSEVSQINSDTSMVVADAWASTVTGQNYVKYFPNGYHVPLLSTLPGGRNVTISSSTASVISTGLAPSTPLSVEIFHNIKRTNASPIKKVAKKNRFVVINCATHTHGYKGPWDLGKSDIIKINAVYQGTTTNTSTPLIAANTTNPDIKDTLLLDSGMRDVKTFNASLRARAGTVMPANTVLLVHVDHFVPDFTTGVGFFAADSYPIDDANTANLHAITTADIPVYISETGIRLPLRDCVDFRPVSIQTSADTGDIDIANTSQVTTAIAAATINPAETITSQIPASGLYYPAPSENMQFDVTYYLPRRDKVYFSDEGDLLVKEGVSGLVPQDPLDPPSGLVLANLLISAFPSLTSPEVENLDEINTMAARGNVRDTSSLTQVSINTPRRYTMADVGQLDKRISRLEYYTSLNLLEQSAASMQITDDTGLDRFKNGIFIDPFTSHVIGDVSNPEYRIAIDPEKTIARPYITRASINCKYDPSTSLNIQQTGSLLMLPYEELVLLQQPFATKYRSASAYAFHWNGLLTLFPNYSNAIDYNQKPAVQVTVNNASPWQSFANSPFGQSWGDWNTKVSTRVLDVDKSVVTTKPPAPAPITVIVRPTSGSDPNVTASIRAVDAQVAPIYDADHDALINPTTGAQMPIPTNLKISLAQWAANNFMGGV